MSDPNPCPHCGKPLPASSPGGLCPECMLRLGASQPTAWPDDTATATALPGSPPPVADIARHFPHLEILACLGRGGMGVVYRARQPKLNRLVALKILAPERGTDPKFAERFLREAQALARLSHPNIVAVHDFGQADGIYYLLMEYVEGRNLRDLLRLREITPEHALAIIPPICEALQFAHDQGVVHRDIKPENVLLDRQGRVKIADFGIAKLVGQDHSHPALTEDQQVVGTPHYMAPEQVEKPQLVDHRADIYSLGVVFYEMLTGELPLGRFPPPSSRIPGVQVDVRLDEVVLHALEKEPDLRYQRASEVKTDVESLRTKAPPKSAAPERSPTVPPRHPSAAPLPLTSPSRTVLAAVPPVLWVGIGTLLGWGLWQLSLAPTQPGWLLPLLLAAGLIYRQRAAHALVSYLALWTFPSLWLNPPWHPIANLGLTLLAGLPVLLSIGWFYPKDPETGLRSGGNWAAGLLFATPPLLFLWFLRGGHLLFGVELEADVRFYVGVLGLPFSAAFGALLLTSAGDWLARFQPPVPPTPPDAAPRTWSPWAIAAALALTVSLPLGGGGIVILDLLGMETRWNPSSEEALVTLGIGAVAALTIGASVLLGVFALRRMRSQPSRTRGWPGAVAATWLWPCLLATVLLTSWRRSESVQTAQQAVLEAQAEQVVQESRRMIEAARGFEPVREIVLRRDSDLQDSFLNLDTGEILSAPSDFVESLRAEGQFWAGGGPQVLAVLDWMRTNEVDLVCREGASGLTLVDGAGLLMSEGAPRQPGFDFATAREVQQAADALAEPLALHTNREPRGMALFWFDPGQGTNTWAIRTRNQRAGLLELRSDREQPDHIRFRYKLVAIPVRRPAPEQP